MKTLRLILFPMLFAVSILANAYDFEVDGIYYNIVSLNDLTCEVTYDVSNQTYKDLRFRGGSQYSSLSTSYPSYKGNVIIPEKVNYKGRELTVIGIGSFAFLNCSELTSLSLPSTISNIKEIVVYSNSSYQIYAGAFDYCNIETFTAGNAYTLHMFDRSYAANTGIKTYDNLETLILSDDFSGVIDVDYSDYKNLKTIRCNSINVPIFSDEIHFSNEQYLNLEVFVPEDAFSVYLNADVWKDFWELKAMKSVKTITLNQSILNLEPEQTFQLLPTVLPEDAYDASVKWSSSDTNVATVDENGIVTALDKGDAVISATATDGSGVTAQCLVHVDLLVKEIEISETAIGLEPKQSKKLEVTVLPDNAFVKDVVWSSNNEEVATVDQQGNVTAIAIGIASISVSTTDGSNLTASCEVTVAELVKSIIVTPDIATVNEEESLQLSCVVMPESATYKGVIWTSEDNNIATVDSNGLVTAVSSGKVKIKATAIDGSNVYGESEITVTAATIEYNGICYQRNSVSTLKIVANTNNPYSGDFFIPSTATFNGQEMKVTEIGIDAFAGCNELTRLVIPNTIIKINDTAFSGCTKLLYVKICDGSTIETNIDNLFPDSPINELYVGSDGITYNSDSRILSTLIGLTLGNNVTTFPPSKVFDNLKYFIVEDGDVTIVEPDDYCSSSTSLTSKQTIQDANTHIYYRLFYLVTYTHLSPILNALQNNILNYIHIGREVQCIDVDTSKTQERIPTTAGSRYQEFGYYDEVNYQYQEMIAKSEYSRHLIETISFEKNEIELQTGECTKLTVLFTPSNASFTALEWSSSDENVATVDIFGNVKKVAEGEAIITATTTDGSKLSATCIITNPGTGLSNINYNELACFDVYNLQGILVRKKCTSAILQSLVPGIYIIRQGDKVKRIRIQ